MKSVVFKQVSWILIGILLCSPFLAPIQVIAEKKQSPNQVNIYFFHSNTCPHCKSESKYLDSIEKKYSYVKVYRYEIHEAKNQTVLAKVEEIYAMKASSVPITIIGNQLYHGYNEETSPLKFGKTIDYFAQYGYQDQLGEYLNIEVLPQYPTKTTNPSLKEYIQTNKNYHLIGSLETDQLDIPMNTLILGILTKLNLISILSISIALLLLQKIKNIKTKIIYLGVYLILSFSSLNMLFFLRFPFNLVVLVAIILFLLVDILKKSKNLTSINRTRNILLLLAAVESSIEYYLSKNYISIFQNILTLYPLTIEKTIFHYISYIWTMGIIYILEVFLLQFILKKITRRQKNFLK